MKESADNKHNVKERTLNIGDTVLVKNKNKGVLDSYYDNKKYKVIKVHGSMITAECDYHKITRNITFFKKVNSDCVSEYNDDDDLSINHSDEEMESNNDTPPLSPKVIVKSKTPYTISRYGRRL